jgi:3-hydroxy acid dehydrogenase/malonic semialdehyde reductase
MLQRFLTRRLTRNFQQFQSQIHRSMSLSAMSARLTGKTVLITGASSGIGRATAFEFSRTAPDIKLILTARRIDTLREIAAELEKESNGKTKVLPVQFDVSKPAEVREFVGKLPEEWRDVDVLVNNA